VTTQACFVVKFRCRLTGLSQFKFVDPNPLGKFKQRRISAVLRIGFVDLLSVGDHRGFGFCKLYKGCVRSMEIITATILDPDGLSCRAFPEQDSEDACRDEQYDKETARTRTGEEHQAAHDESILGSRFVRLAHDYPLLTGPAEWSGWNVSLTARQTPFPTERNSFQRFSATAEYTVDPDVVRRMGLKGEVVTKLRYVYERNHNWNWATDNMTPYIPTPDQTVDLTGSGRSIFLAYANPNYTAQIIVMSLAAKW
jgi:hypothetical protein